MSIQKTLTTKPSNKLFIMLALAGCIPFIATAIYLTTDMKSYFSIGDAKKYISVYGLVIISFMAGSNWGVHLNRSDKWRIALPLLSNAITIVVFFAFVALQYSDYLVAQILFFIFLLLVDIKLLQSGIISKIYFNTRFNATLIVIACLFVTRISV